MFNANKIAGKPVMSREGGEKIATVKDLVVSKDYKRIIALLVEGGGLFGHAKVIPMSKVVSFGSDVVVVTDNSAVVPVEEAPEIKESLDNKDKLIRKKVFTERGDVQGRVGDVCFQDTSGTIVGYELVDGVFKNLPDQKAFLPVADVISIGPDALMMETEALPRLVGDAAGAIPPEGSSST